MSIKNHELWKLSKAVFLAVAVIVLATATAKNYVGVDLSPPQDGTYRSDELIFLKTFYLMEGGDNYYRAFQAAVANDFRGIVLTKDSFQWRLPTVFYVWKLTANTGGQIWRNFWILVFAALIASYFLMKKFVGPWLALLSSFLLLPYFADTLVYQTSWLFTEWWGWFGLVFGLALLVNKRMGLAWILLVLAAVTRELLVIPILGMLIVSLWRRRNRRYFLSILMAIIMGLLIHRAQVNSFMGGATNSSGMPVMARLHAFNKQAFLAMISFSMRQYPLVQYRSHWAVVGLAMLATGITWWRRPKNADVYYLLMAGLLPLGMFPFITTSIYNDYWGVVFMPTLLISTPLLFLKKS